MSFSRSDIEDLILWWFVGRNSEIQEKLDPGFQYTRHHLISILEDVLIARQSGASVENLVIRDILVSDVSAAAFFEALDPVTGLTYRMAWLIRFSQDSILSVLEISQDITDYAGLEQSDSESAAAKR